MENILEIQNLTKSFSGTKALDAIDFTLRRGEVLGLVGQNGSGKSTLIKVLAGYHQPDAGGIATVDGRKLQLGSAKSAFAAGLRFVHQDLGLVSSLGALDNLALGRGYRRNRLGTISWRAEAKAGKKLLEQLGYSFDLRKPVGELKASERTGIAIARALEGYEKEARVLVLDEPTASLPAAEADQLFAVVQAVNAAGVSVVYVSHRFKEIFALCDRVTVLKDGLLIATREVADLTEPGLVRLTIGRDLEMPATRHDAPSASEGEGETVLSVHGLAGDGVESFSLDVAAGEIVGVAGVTGSGREALGGLIFGSVERRGEVAVLGVPVKKTSPAQSIAAGISYVPAERLANAAFADMTLRENLTISGLAPFYGLMGLRRGQELGETRHWLREFQVKPQDPQAVLATLSGGNQQKVMIARALRLKPRVLLLDEPTQGVDVGAKQTIHDIVRLAAERGSGVVVFATESEELIGLCDRIAVMVAGRCIGVFNPKTITADDLTELTMGASDKDDQKAEVPA